MTEQYNELSNALVLFLGFGSASSPLQDRARLIQEFGTSRGTAVESQVVDLVDELGKIPVDWSKYSLESAGNMVLAKMHVRHPGLTDTALRALAWKFTFDWR